MHARFRGLPREHYMARRGEALPRRRRTARLFASLSMAAVLGVGGVVAGTNVAFATDAVVVCTVSGSLSFGAPLTAVPGSNTVSLSVSGPCLGTTSTTITLVGGPAGGILSCEAGVAASFQVVASSSNGVLPPTAATAIGVAGPATFAVDLNALPLGAPGLEGAIALAWSSPLAVVSCAAGGVTSVPVTGTATLLYASLLLAQDP